MRWLQEHSWQLLLTMTVLVAVIGLFPLIFGINEDPSVPLGISGLTAAEIEASSAPAYRLVDSQVRNNGIALIVIGVLLSVVVIEGFRKNQPWSWWAMWILPIWAASVFVLTFAVGVAPGQAPPTPMISGPIFAVLAGSVLLISLPRFRQRDG